MSSYCHIVKNFENLVKLGNFKTLIFEGGQGLALDENNKEALPHVTASKTGSSVPVERVRDICDFIEICYVTRTYFTRHGAGPFPTECSVADFEWDNLSDHVDLTNVPNQFQGYFRYGKFDFDEFLGRFNRDYLSSLAIRSKLKSTCFVTHCNEVPMNDILKDFFAHGIYQSSSRYAEDVTEYKGPLEVVWKRRKEDDR